MRCLAIFCFSAASAIFALQYGPQETSLILIGIGLAALLAALFLKNPKRLAALILAFGLSFGSCYTLLYDRLFVQPVEPFEDTQQQVTVTLCSYPEVHRFGTKSTALLDVGAVLPVKVQFYGGKELLDCKPGDKITADAKLRSAAYSHGEKITSFTSKGSHLLVYSKGELTIEAADHVPLRYFPLQFNRMVQEKIREIYSGTAQILMTALLTGNRSGFDDTLYSKLSETGVTHVTAVSGMHCAFLFGMIHLLIRNRRKATLISLPILFFFMLMVGATPSVTRACFMLALLSIAPLVNRENDSFTTMGAALLLILLKNPYAAASISLQLSFLSVTGILLVSRPLYHWLMHFFEKVKGKQKWLIAFVASAFSTTCSASIFTVPLVAHYFGCVSLISPVTNLLCLSAVSFAFGIGIVSVLVGFISVTLAGVIAIPAAAGLDYFMAVVDILSKVPYHALYTSNPYLVYWLGYFYAMIAALFLMKGRRPKTLIMASALSVSTLALVISLPILTEKEIDMKVKVLNVGQGESLLITSGGESAIMDCGSSNSWINAGTVAANELNTMGHTTLDYLILSHYHHDHANGLDTLFSRVDVRNLIIPVVEDEESQRLQQGVMQVAAENQIHTILIDTEQEFEMGHAKMTIVPPLGAGSTNEEGLSLLCSCKDFDMLVTGDMDSDTEHLLLRKIELPDLEVLIAGHHGSKYATCEELLRASTPEVSVIPTGVNSYGHPAPEVLERLAAHHVQVFRTDLDGTVSISVY